MPTRPPLRTRIQPANKETSTGGVRTFTSGCTLLDLGSGNGWAIGRVINIVGDRSSSKCIRDAFIQTRQGLLYIDDYGADLPRGMSELRIQLAVEKEKTVTTSHFYKEEVDRTVKYVTKHGFELIATENHQIKILRPNLLFDMVRLDELSPGDYVVIAPETDLFPDKEVSISFIPKKKVRSYSEISLPPTLNVSLAEFLGFLVADGSLSRQGLDLTCYEKGWKQGYAIKLSQELFPGAFRRYKEGLSFSAQTKEAIDYLFTKPLDGCTARHKFVPPLILRSPRHIQAAFLKALLSCNSSVKPSCLAYTTASRRLAREVQMMLLNFGIVASLTETDFRAPQWDEPRLYFRIDLAGKRYDKFLSMIGLCFPLHKEPSKTDKSDYLSIPFVGDLLRQEITNTRQRLGWTKNGKLRDGSRFPETRMFCRNRGSSLTREFLAYMLQLTEGLLDSSFVEKCDAILGSNYVFECVESIEYINEKQTVYDVHVPDGHLFWCSGTISHNTGLAIEACVNFARLYGEENVRYNETEAAFSREYAIQDLGLPPEIKFVGDNDSEKSHGSTTIEEFNDDLADFLRDRSDGHPCLYILDSLDALSDDAEMGREIGAATYGTGKAKMSSELFRRQISDIGKKNCTLFIISQIRDKIGVTFGEKKTRSGGRALDFYASQVWWLSEIEKVKRTVTGVDRIVGVKVQAANKKNKIGRPFRRAEFTWLFNYGIDDELSNIEWLATNKIGAGQQHLTKELNTYKREVEHARRERDRPHLSILAKELRDAVTARWNEIEEHLSPYLSKYQ